MKGVAISVAEEANMITSSLTINFLSLKNSFLQYLLFDLKYFYKKKKPLKI